MENWRQEETVPKHTKQPARNLWPLIILLGAFTVFLIILWVVLKPQPNRNVLAIGEEGNSEYVSLHIQPPTELDFLSKTELLRLRSLAVQQYPELLAADYVPDKSIFGQIVDGLPWWGIEGQFFYGNGENSIAGPSEESRFFLNPYLLVAADFYDWWAGKITENDLADFSLTCLPYSLDWWPEETIAEATYDARCVERGQNYTFDLIAYNARDMNMNYIFVSYPNSTNIGKINIPTAAYKNPQYIHQGGSCGYPGGCNNMSPSTPEIEGLEILKLPAQVIIWLWEEKPTSPEQLPDMTFVLTFE